MKIEKLNRKVNEIYNNPNLNWEVKYDKIFSDKISKKVFSKISLNYYDPDTTYEEDVTAFVNAFNEYFKNEKI